MEDIKDLLSHLYEIFKENPHSLVQRYARQEQLSEFELDRIRFEGTVRTLSILIQQVGPQDPLSQELSQLLQIDLQHAEFLL